MPAIVTVAALVVLVPPLAFDQPRDTWLYRSLALLLIGCPCAPVISVPASIASALSTDAFHGLLMKGGAVIEASAKVSRVAFEKTGTLTHGRPPGFQSRRETSSWYLRSCSGQVLLM